MCTIGLFTRWNATCGVSMHAELIGREFIRMGFDIKVFAPHIQSADRWWHHRIVREDEEFVIRCYDEIPPSRKGYGNIEEDKILREDFDYLIVESYTPMPQERLERLIPRMRREKKDLKVVAVIHEGAREHIRYDIRIFDAVVVFDERYVDEIFKLDSAYRMNAGDAVRVSDAVVVNVGAADFYEAYEAPLIEVIPYPCMPVLRRWIRKFGEDGYIKFFSFGRQIFEEYNDYIHALDELSAEYDILYHVVRSDGLLPISRDWLVQERRRLSNKALYEMLHSSDIHLLPKSPTKFVVVSSTLHQCLGSLCITVVPDTRHFEMLPKIGEEKPAVVYENVEDLVNKLRALINDGEYRENVRDAAMKYVEKNRCDKIAKKFIQLFHRI